MGKIKIIPLTESEIARLPFPDTARKIGGIMVLDSEPYENHENAEKFIKEWEEVVSTAKEFRVPIFEEKEDR